MCGIAGMLLAGGKAVDHSLIEAMGRVLTHRGPDNFGCYVDRNYGIAHTRLSILDLSHAGNQPLKNERYSLVYNGEIYNYLDLRKKLHELKVKLTGTSDTEVLFHHLITFGVEGTLPKLRGMFAFSFYDSNEGTLYVCRDKLGIKPLVYSEKGGDFFWASETKALTKVVQLEIDPSRLLLTAAEMFDGRNEETVFCKVKNVPPGSYLIVKSGHEPKVVQYYEISEDISEHQYKSLDKLSLQAAAEQLRGLLKNSIDSMLLSDAPMGVFASGGIDSSLIAAIAFSSQPDLSLFSANVHGVYSEIDDARLLSKAIGTPLYEAPYQTDSILSTWAACTWYYETPIVTHLNALPLSEVARLARDKKVKAVLTGEGSDELFLGYAASVANRYRKLTYPVEILKKLYGLVPSVRRYLFPNDNSSIHGFFPELMSNFEERVDKRKFEEAYSFLSRERREEQIVTPLLMRSHLASLLHRNDRMGMMASIESRFPFLEDDIIRFALNLPVKFKVRTVPRVHDRRHPFLMDKAVVRRAIRGVVPEKLARKVKHGFPTHGLQSLRIQPGFFDNGYLENKFQLSDPGREELLSGHFDYFAAKLSSIEVFGRIFEMQQTPDEVANHLRKFAKVDPHLNSIHEIL